MRCQRDLRELKKADALTLISQMETSPQHRRLVAGTRPATTLSPVAYITTDFIGCAQISQIFRKPEAGSLPRVVRKICEIMGGRKSAGSAQSA